ncbi:hypothetical protein [Jannaschia sp. R86511]|uniref:hypothetical protein n=1 Tax=Jannaschia sp. R86511 TaxID=3093853 RepID=UPI0036D40107
MVEPTAATVLQRVAAAPDVVTVAPSRATTDHAHPEHPGDPAHPGHPAHVWYVSYGSNLLRERFEVYLLGGRVPGLDREYPGGTGTSRATGERAVLLPGVLRLALDAPSWGGGGVAFWDPTGPGPGVLARAWRVRREQFLEVVHLENGGTDRRGAPWPVQVLRTGTADVGDGWYRRLLSPGSLDGEPLLTFTHPDAGTLATRAPSPAYRSVVARGLVETFAAPGRGALGPTDAQAYLADALAS